MAEAFKSVVKTIRMYDLALTPCSETPQYINYIVSTLWFLFFNFYPETKQHWPFDAHGNAWWRYRVQPQPQWSFHQDTQAQRSSGPESQNLGTTFHSTSLCTLIPWQYTSKQHTLTQTDFMNRVVSKYSCQICHPSLLILLIADCKDFVTIHLFIPKIILPVRTYWELKHRPYRIFRTYYTLSQDVWLHVSIIVLASPNKSTRRLQNLSNHVINEPVFIPDLQLVKLTLVVPVNDIQIHQITHQK